MDTFHPFPPPPRGSRPLLPCKQLRKLRRHRRAFTLIEVLVAASVLTLLVTLLASAVHNTLNIWNDNEQRSNSMQNLRSAVALMRRDLEQIVLPPRRDTLGFQLLVNPPGAGLNGDVCNKSTIFFQAPVATRRDAGEIAIVGYFVRKTDANTYQLCRLLINPDDADYQILDTPAAWLNQNLLDEKANPTEENYLQGLLMEHVPGLWITPYEKTPTGLQPLDHYDSRAHGNLPPARLEVSLVALDEQGAEIVKSGAVPLPEAANYASANAYIQAAPAPLRKHLHPVTFNVLYPY